MGGRVFCVVSVAGLFGGADICSERVSELLYGEEAEICDESGGFYEVRVCHDGYVGFVAKGEVLPLEDSGGSARYRVTAGLAPIFSGSDIKSRLLGYLSLGSHIVNDREGDFHRIIFPHLGGDVGYVHYMHVGGLDFSGAITGDSIIFAARRFLGCPYVWGGRSFFGIDCSGLVQMVCSLHGLPCRRDSYMQMEDLGRGVAIDGDMECGDILFWRGHVGFFTGSHLIHAYGGVMEVVEQPCDEIFKRLQEATNGGICAVRRLVD